MIVVNRSPQQTARNQGTMPSMGSDNGIVSLQGAHFPITTSDTAGIHPKRNFADEPTVENRPSTRFRLPPRYRHDDDRDDAHVIGKDGTTYLSTTFTSSRTSAAIPEIGSVNRNLHDVMVGSENPTFHYEHHHNLTQRDGSRVPTLTSWTVAATSGHEPGHPAAWRRHFLDDPRRIPTAPSGQETHTSARNNTMRRDRPLSVPVRHEVLLSDMRYNYTAAGSIPQSMTTFPQQRFRHMHAPTEAMQSRSAPPYRSELNSSRNMEVSMNGNAVNEMNTATTGSFNHDTTARTESLRIEQNVVPETFRWRHPNGRFYEQVNVVGQPPVVSNARKSQSSTSFHNAILHPPSLKTHRSNIAATSTKSNAISSSGQTQEQPSDRTNLSHCTTSVTQRGLKQLSLPHGQQPQQNIRPATLPPPTQPIVFQKVKGFDKLDLLCTATLEVGELHDNPTGCSCPKSKCVALYCDCFKAGRRCHPNRCSCLDCKNTIAESGIDGARTKAIRNILARNPRAFNTAGMGNPLHKLPPGEVACNCVRSKCLKLYCSCFHHGKICRPDICTCVGCENTSMDRNGNREAAIQHVIEKRADAFVIKPKIIGQGCACKNNKCLRKYCECYRTGLQCNPNKCTCRDCENLYTTNKRTMISNTTNIISTNPNDHHAHTHTNLPTSSSRLDPIIPQQVAHV